jgi:formylglycine-generating enzyme required for sulfatase activity
VKARCAVIYAALLLSACAPSEPPFEVALMEVPAGVVRYQLLDGPAVLEESVHGFAIMQRQVSQAEYALCVEAGACAGLDSGPAKADQHLPAVGLSWLDAQAYATWLSLLSGQTYRLPYYGEWVLAAGEAFIQDEAIVDDPQNPSRRWLLEYEREARRGPASKALRAFGEQGQNKAGLLDISGNVWEWTLSCFGQPPGMSAADGFCGIRIAAGRHPSALSDFIRDPVAGACSVGTPPAHLGLRLVRESN